MPIYDFALIEVSQALFPFSKQLRPVCLPSKYHWKDSDFVGAYGTVSGYGRVEKVRIEKKEQNACETMVGFLRVINNDDAKCQKVKKLTYLVKLLTNMTFSAFQVSRW